MSIVRRPNPSKTLTFRVKWNGKVVAVVSKCSLFNDSTTAGAYRRENDRSARTFEPVTLGKGAIQDARFWAWIAGGVEEAQKRRRELAIEAINVHGVVTVRYTVFQCWVSEYQQLPDLDAAGKAVVIEHLRLECEGWERDSTVQEPDET
jgi:phage tail-like protein